METEILVRGREAIRLAIQYHMIADTQAQLSVLELVPIFFLSKKCPKNRFTEAKSWFSTRERQFSLCSHCSPSSSIFRLCLLETQVSYGFWKSEINMFYYKSVKKCVTKRDQGEKFQIPNSKKWTKQLQNNFCTNLFFTYQKYYLFQLP